MAEQTDSNGYQRGLALTEAGRHKEALDCFQEHLMYHPDDDQALNDTGAVMFCLGRTDESLHYLLKAHQLAPDKPQIVWNLVESYLAAGRPEEAAELFDSMEKNGIINTDVINRCSNAFLNKENKISAINMLLRSLNLEPKQEVLRGMIEIIKNKTAKVAIFCGADGRNFLDDIVEYLQERFEVRFFEGRNQQQMYELMRWSDISWFEWCTDLAAAGSQLPKVCKNIVRLHRYEAYLHWPAQVNWANIDLLIMAGNSFVKEALLKQVPDIESKTTIETIPNGVNLDRFRFVNRPRGKNIVFLANLRMVKNPAFILQCMQKLHYIDAAYQLFIAGRFQDYALLQYITHMINTLGLNEFVHLDGWQKDINSYLADKHYVASTSIIESQGMGVLEGMACGLKPVVHNFPGAEEIFGEGYLFNISEDFCRQVLSEDYEPIKYRRFVEERYSHKRQLAGINGIFTQMQFEIDSERSADEGYGTQAEKGDKTAAVKTESAEKDSLSNLYR